MKASTKSTARIEVLAPVLIDKIAAGEVIEAPYSVAKELVENALDAGATRILFESTAGGIQRLYIEDNGRGIHPEDMPLTVQRHATSKIRDLADLDTILTFGFRGEALAAIAAVSHLDLRSRRSNLDLGYRLESRGGEIVHQAEDVCNPGTTIAVSDLFYATPARRKYIKSERAENQRIARELQKIALAQPDVHFIYKRDAKEHYNYPATNSLKARIAQIFPSKIITHLLEIEFEKDGLQLHGFVTDENYYRANREGQYIFINHRPVEVKNFSYLVKKAYGELLPPGSHPYFFLMLDLDPQRVDVNVHPQKKEVRLMDQSLLHNLIMQALGPVLRPRNPLAFQPAAAQNTHMPLMSHSMLMEPELLKRPAPLPQTFTIGPQEGRINSNLEETANSGNQVHLQENEIGIHRHDPAPVEDFIPRRHFGVIFGTYILAEGNDCFYIIDQHTAHERVNYEKKRNELESNKHIKQPLLTPVVFEMLADEKQEILAFQSELTASGFEVEDFGPRSLALREVPGYIDPGSEKDVLMHLIQRIIAGERGVRLYDEYAAMKACKASIKKNDYISGDLLSGIIEELAACENPSRCPHGRPTMLKIDRKELDQLFHRT